LLKTETHVAAVAKVVAKFGRIDFLLNNGGRSQRAIAERTSIEVDRAMLELNVIGETDKCLFWSGTMIYDSCFEDGNKYGVGRFV
jgi:NAD(P)-dependent dehydrogenase (short-subunit alcohol dehydrogenase family)